jgi:hypothetical protein
MRDTRKQQYIAHGNHARRSCSAARQGWTTATRAGARSSRRGVVRRPVCRRRVRQVASRGAWMDSSQHAVLSAAQSPPWRMSWRGCRPQSRVAPRSGDRSDESDQCDEAAASASRFALRARGPPAGPSSKMAESVGGTSNDTVGSTANGRRSRSDYAGGGDRGLPRLRLREDQAARPPEPRRRKRAPRRATRRVGKRPAAAEDAGREGCLPSGSGHPLSSPGSRACGRPGTMRRLKRRPSPRRQRRRRGGLPGGSVAAAGGCPAAASPPLGAARREPHSWLCSA